MSRSYRITVRGVMSERFCRGFAGMARTPGADPDRTVLQGDLRDEACLVQVLARLQNLGLDVMSVEAGDDRSDERRP